MNIHKDEEETRTVFWLFYVIGFISLHYIFVPCVLTYLSTLYNIRPYAPMTKNYSMESGPLTVDLHFMLQCFA